MIVTIAPLYLSFVAEDFDVLLSRTIVEAEPPVAVPNVVTNSLRSILACPSVSALDSVVYASSGRLGLKSIQSTSLNDLPVVGLVNVSISPLVIPP